MKKSTTIVLSFVFIFLILSANVSATQRGIKVSAKTPTGKSIPLYTGSYALVIGNGDYTNGWDPLPGAMRDVKDVARALKDNGFNVTLKTNVTRNAFRQAFGRFFHEYGRDKTNRLFFYYAGHGYTQKLYTGEDQGYLVMVDAPAPEKDPVGFDIASIDMQVVVTQAKKVKARHVLFMFDSCFSGAILNLRERVVPETISDSVSLPVRQFITAGRANEPVPDHSIFKQAFLDLLEGRDKEPIPDGYITGEELGLYLKNKVPEYNAGQHPQYGKIKDIRLDKGDFVFALKMPSVHQAPAMRKSAGTTNYDSIIREREANRKKWDAWQSRIENDLSRVEQYDRSAHLTSKEKIKAWESFLGPCSSDNPYTERDDGFRRKAIERIRYWKGYKPSGKLFVDTTPSNATIKILNIGPKFYQRMDLEPGRYHVEVSKEGYETDRRWVTLSAGEDENISVRLDPVKVAAPAPVPVSRQPEGTFTNSLGMKFVYIRPGSFMMGSALSSSKVAARYGGKETWYKFAHPQHHVTLTKGFYLQTTEVTQGQWERVMGSRPWSGKVSVRENANNPAVYVSWEDCQQFIRKLNGMEGTRRYRLPTEAEWEYACRAGSTTRFFFGNSVAQLGGYTWYKENAVSVGDDYGHGVGTKRPNAWGLYDMHGNVWEWCRDWYGDYPPGSVTDPAGPSLGADRVARGGSWIDDAGFCLSAKRVRAEPGNRHSHQGFRLSMAR